MVHEILFSNRWFRYFFTLHSVFSLLFWLEFVFEASLKTQKKIQNERIKEKILCHLQTSDSTRVQVFTKAMRCDPPCISLHNMYACMESERMVLNLIMQCDSLYMHCCISLQSLHDSNGAEVLLHTPYVLFVRSLLCSPFWNNNNNYNKI